ncbi:hypothetical protein [Nitrosomonas communis]|uniref:Uncharacterized protein n=1 Tax=Nitrosomonas communis TaxID=44574 RepID=A0A1H2XFA5_9PROT|nr:hypothetical protein [Nitrosomonas communis]SDW90939.1 hypothetical protein SAMN05421882_103724 [Nitrosomonas communis]
MGKKILRRVAHLQKRHDKYEIPGDFIFIAVSRFPEVVAHFSDILILSIEEFNLWLEAGANTKSFADFYAVQYSTPTVNFLQNDIKKLGADGLSLVSI